VATKKQKSKELQTRVAAVTRDMIKARIELACYTSLYETEMTGGPMRLRELNELVSLVNREEAEMQREFEEAAE
jgi:hypothetical protein